MRGDKHKIPNSCRAVVSGKIVTVKNGRRVVKEYQSGEPLFGEIQNDAPPFTGFVRGYGKKKS